eukprot:11401071-Alexandrium_andersonii.AAC.1
MDHAFQSVEHERRVQVLVHLRRVRHDHLGAAELGPAPAAACLAPSQPPRRRQSFHELPELAWHLAHAGHLVADAHLEGSHLGAPHALPHPLLAGVVQPAGDLAVAAVVVLGARLGGPGFVALVLHCGAAVRHPVRFPGFQRDPGGPAVLAED